MTFTVTFGEEESAYEKREVLMPLWVRKDDAANTQVSQKSLVKLEHLKARPYTSENFCQPSKLVVRNFGGAGPSCLFFPSLPLIGPS